MVTLVLDKYGKKLKSRVVSGTRSDEPTFTRLFTHDTWTYYTGKPPLDRERDEIENRSLRHSTTDGLLQPALRATVQAG